MTPPMIDPINSPRSAGVKSERVSYFRLSRNSSRHSSSDTPTSPKTVRPSDHVRAAHRGNIGKSDPPTSASFLDLQQWLGLTRTSMEASPASSDYMASDGHQYPRVVLSRPGAPTFLPSEMTRVNTPSIQSATALRKKRSVYRSLFSDERRAMKLRDSKVEKAHPARASKSPSGEQPRSPLTQSTRRSELHRSEPQKNAILQDDAGQRPQDFFRQRVDLNMSESDASSNGSFALEIPDHLPSSPLCPLHVKHHGGQKTMCPHHGRGKNPKREGKRSRSEEGAN